MRDSGERQLHVTGAYREPQNGRPRYDLIPVEALLGWAKWMARGAEKYSDRNWEKGMPISRYEASAHRHLAGYMLGDTQEDHLSAMLFNVGAIMHHEYHIKRGSLPQSLDDRPEIRRLSNGEAKAEPEESIP